jgi:hypothetical protein
MNERLKSLKDYKIEILLQHAIYLIAHAFMQSCIHAHMQSTIKVVYLSVGS